MNSSNAAMFSADVASRITHTEPVASDGVSNRSAKFLEHAANMSLWALKIVPAKINSEKHILFLFCAIKKLFFSLASREFYIFSSRHKQNNKKKTHFCQWPWDVESSRMSNAISNPHWWKISVLSESAAEWIIKRILCCSVRKHRAHTKKKYINQRISLIMKLHSPDCPRQSRVIRARNVLGSFRKSYEMKQICCCTRHMARLVNWWGFPNFVCERVNHKWRGQLSVVCGLIDDY